MSTAAFGFLITFILGYNLCFFWELMPSLERKVWVTLIFATAIFSVYEVLFPAE